MSVAIGILILASVLLNITPGIYLRYLPFRQFILPEQKRKLLTCYIICLIAEFCFISTLLTTGFLTISILTIKFFVLSLWLPFFIVNVILIPGYIPQHIFVLGIQFIYTYLLHSVATLMYYMFINSDQLLAKIFAQCSFYLIIFAITYPLIRNFFKNMFTVRNLDNYYWRQICMLPILLLTSNIYFIVENKLVVLEQIPPRIILAISTFIICYCMSLDFKWLQDRETLAHRDKLLSLQVQAFKNQAQLLEDSQKALSIQRHDMRHHSRILYTLIEEGHTAEALQHLETLEENLSKTRIHAYCQNLLINAILSIYIPKAKEHHIPIEYEIKAPTHFEIDEINLATVISNLLENAFHANYLQPKDERGLQFKLNVEDKQLKLSIKNRISTPVLLGDDGLPVTHEKGHGLGMQSLATFAEKNNGMVLCTQEAGWFSTYVVVKIAK